MKFIKLSAGLMLAGAVGLAQANLLANGSFELTGAAPALDVGGGVSAYFYTVGSSDLPGWSILGGVAEQVHDTSSAPFLGSMASDGDKWLDLTGVSGYDKGVSATFATQVGGSYTLSFELGALMAAGFGNVTAEVLVNGSSQGLFTNLTSVAPGTWQSAGIDWETKTVAFTATLASTTISFLGRANGLNSNDSAIALDNVSVVPEPEAYGLALAGLGVLGVGLGHRRLTARASRA